MDREDAVLRIAKAVDERGGRTFKVGGCVRDSLMGSDIKDIDLEIHGIEASEIGRILDDIGETQSYGAAFGIFSVKGMDLDIAVPRKETATGRGHRDFLVDADPYIGTERAASRRDFTINALMQDVITGELIDHFGGAEDIKNRVIRHVNGESFAEDPLRVLRAAQFASRFGFTVAEDTVRLCRGISTEYLSRERVGEEMKKALMLSREPSAFFRTLDEMDQLGIWFCELRDLIGIEQDPVYHPEGDAFSHTMEVLDKGAVLREHAERPYPFMLLCLTHDFGKAITTEYINGRYHAYGHETEGLPAVERFLERLAVSRRVSEYVLNMVPLHMKPNIAAFNRSRIKVTNRIFYQAASPRDLVLFARADRPLFVGETPFGGDGDFLTERLGLFREIMSKPYVRGRDLIEAGMEPGDDFADMLEYAGKLRLAGVDKASALKQTLAYGRKHRKEVKRDGKNIQLS